MQPFRDIFIYFYPVYGYYFFEVIIVLKNLVTLRKNNKMNQRQLAELMNVNQNTISRWEKGERQPNNDDLRKLSDIFHVSVDYLLSDDDGPKNKKVPKDLRKILEDEEIILNGRMLSDDDKQKMLKIIEAAFWEAKELNKRK